MSQLRHSDFEIGETIGFGTVGTIYQVSERATGIQYALKLLSPAVSMDANVVTRFEREIMVLSKLSHPNIVAYIGEGKHEGQLFYVMELIRAGTVKELLHRSGPLTWPEAVECGRQIASALQHAHNHGIIHRDLKPGNVFLTEQGQAKLGDFGIARDLRAHDLTDIGLTVGTYAYMAPELVKGTREITGQVDLYALGCVIFEMLTGRPPYQGDNFAEIFEQHLSAKPPRLQQNGVACPDAIDNLVVALLAKSPEDRPFNARAVQGILGELSEVVETEPNGEGDSMEDRAASSVRPVQLTLQNRIQATHAITQRDVSWRAISVLMITLLAAIVAMFFLSG